MKKCFVYYCSVGEINPDEFKAQTVLEVNSQRLLLTKVDALIELRDILDAHIKALNAVTV